MAKRESPKREVRTAQIQIHELVNCPGCGVAPGHVHVPGCLAEMYSHCGHVRKGCKSQEHDPAFSRWTGIFPGVAECFALGLIKDDGSPDMVAFIAMDLPKVLFSKPHEDNEIAKQASRR
jgi:hypothetical protein